MHRERIHKVEVATVSGMELFFNLTMECNYALKEANACVNY